MSGGKENRRDRAHDQQRAARHEVHNSLYAVELTTAAMVSSDRPEDREALSRVVADEVARVRALLPTLSEQGPPPEQDFPRQSRRGES